MDYSEKLLLLIVLFCNNSSTGGLNFGTLGSSTATATTSASSVGFGSGLFGSKSTTGFTLGGTSTGRKKNLLQHKFESTVKKYVICTQKLSHHNVLTFFYSSSITWNIT